MLGKYNKNLTGAVITYKPDDIILYEKEAFDIQINNQGIRNIPQPKLFLSKVLKYSIISNPIVALP